jgi:hypothetical protein
MTGSLLKKSVLMRGIGSASRATKIPTGTAHGSLQSKKVVRNLMMIKRGGKNLQKLDHIIKGLVLLLFCESSSSSTTSSTTTSATSSTTSSIS